jgi:protein-tyrosine phosphatase
VNTQPSLATFPPVFLRVRNVASLTFVHDGRDCSLFLGTARDAADIRHVRHVVNATECAPNHFEGAKVSYLRVAVPDSGECDLDRHVGAFFEFMQDAASKGEPVLVHCRSGRSRSATLVLAWAVARCGYTLADAWAKLTRERECVNPNEGFRRWLVALEEQCYGRVSVGWFDRSTRGARGRKCRKLC